MRLLLLVVAWHYQLVYLLAERSPQERDDRNRQRSRRIDMYEIIVLERSGTFQHYFVRGVLQ